MELRWHSLNPSHLCSTRTRVAMCFFWAGWGGRGSCKPIIHPLHPVTVLKNNITNVTLEHP